uniref:Chromo domain-containing protein n=1 Tax=Globodera rostochiensis TaxID=31243 RepID=A0A914HSS3_GLORO
MSGRPNQLNKWQPRRSNRIEAQKNTANGKDTTPPTHRHSSLPPQPPNAFAASSPPPQSITAAAAAVAADTPSNTITAAAAAASATDTHCTPQSPSAVAPTPSITASLISGEEEMPVDEAGNGDQQQQQQQDGSLLQPEQQPQASHDRTRKAAAVTAKAKRRQAKNWNKKRRIPIAVSASAKYVPKSVQLNPRTQSYEVESILASFERNGRKAYYVNWLGYRGAQSWTLSEDTDATEFIANFCNKSSVEGCLDAFLGNEISESLAAELRNNPKYLEVCQLFGIGDHLHITEFNVTFCPNTAIALQKKAIDALPKFIRDCMTP